MAQLSSGPTANINPRIQVPESASIGIFTKIPVSLHTGVPDIEVPLYDLAYKELRIPISVNYHNAIGNRVDVFPGEVGLGWQLTAGGSITLLERSLEYEEFTTGIGGQLRAIDEDLIRSENWHTQEKLDSLLKYNLQLYPENNKPYYYNYNFLGHHGYIMMDHKGIPRIISADGDYFKVEIEKTVQHSFDLPLPAQIGWSGTVKNILFSNTAYRFTLTDKSGIKYVFGGRDEAVGLRRTGIEWAGGDPYGRDNEGVVPFKWELTSIESPNGYKIGLNYSRGDFYLEYSESQEFKIAYTPGSSSTHQSTHNRLPKTYASRITATLINPVYLSSIVSPIDSLDFSTSIANDQLKPHNESNLFHYQNSHQTHFHLFSDILSASLDNKWPLKYNRIRIFTRKSSKPRSSVSFRYTTSSNERMKLKEIYLKGSETNASTQIYKFDYDPNKLPPYLSGRTDHMGFYNGRVDVDSNATPLIRITNNIGNNKYSLTREPNAALTKNEILTKITYPTGGSCIFDFEQHDYSKIAKKWPFNVEEQAATKITCGLRIRRINYYTKTNELSHFKEYSYVTTSGKSSGVLSYTPYYFEEVEGTITKPTSLFGVDPSKIGKSTKLWRFNTNGLNPLTGFDGSHITYSRVVEREGTNGSNIYVYSNYDNGYHDLPALNYVSDHSGIKKFINDFPGISRKIERGLALEHIVLNEQKDTLKFVKNDYYKYDDYLKYQLANQTNEDKFIRLVKKAANSIYHEFGIISYTAASYKLLCYYPYQKKSIFKNYLEGGVANESKEYLYDNFNNLVSTKTYNSRSKNVLDTLSYPYNYTGIASYAALVARHQIADAVGAKYFVDNILRMEKSNEYSLTSGIPRLNITKERSSLGSTFRENVKINHYDSFGNPVEIEQADGSKTCYLWGYQGQYPVVVIKNTDYNTIKDQISYEGLQDLALSKSKLELLLFSIEAFHPHLHYQYYTYIPSVGISTSTDERGRSTFYVYDNSNRLTAVKDHDGNILKTYCYNYAGQLIDCFSEIPLDLKVFTTWYGGKTRSEALSNPVNPGPFDPQMSTQEVYCNSGSFASSLFSPPNTGFYADVYGKAFIPDGFYTTKAKVNATTYLWVQIKDGQIIWSNGMILN